jgi:hypothetical protein
MPLAGRVYEFSSGLLEHPVPKGSSIVRIHHTRHAAVWFGPQAGNPPVYRFDAPAGEFRTLYGAAELTGAFVETVLRRARRIISRHFVEHRRWTVLTPRRDLVLAKIFDEGLILHGVTADICTGDDYSASQRFAADIHATFHKVDGIAYRARHNNGQICYALFDRVDPHSLEKIDSHDFKDEWEIVNEIMRSHGAVWDPETPLAPV